MTTDPKKGDQTSVAEHRVKLNRVVVACPKCGTESELDKERPKGKPALCGGPASPGALGGTCGEKLTTEPKPEKGDK